MSELVAIQNECDEWLQNLPERLQEGATAEALQAILDVDLDELQAIGFCQRSGRAIAGPGRLQLRSLGLRG